VAELLKFVQKFKMAAVCHLELLFGYPGPPTKFRCWPEACVQISCRSDLYLRRYVRSNISLVWLKTPIRATKNLRFRGILTPKHYFSSSRPPKGTSLAETRAMIHRASKSVQRCGQDAVRRIQIQESSAKLTNQRVSYAFTSSPFSFHACHILPASKFQYSYSCILLIFYRH